MLYRAGRVELLAGSTGDVAAAGKFQCVLVRAGSSYLDEHPATMAAFSNLLAATASTGKSIDNVVVTVDTVTNRVLVSADAPAWTGLTPTEVIVGLVIYRVASNVPYYGLTLGQPVTIPGSGDYTFPFNPDGIFEI